MDLWDSDYMVIFCGLMLRLDKLLLVLGSISKACFFVNLCTGINNVLLL